MSFALAVKLYALCGAAVLWNATRDGWAETWRWTAQAVPGHPVWSVGWAAFCVWLLWPFFVLCAVLGFWRGRGWTGRR